MSFWQSTLGVKDDTVDVQQQEDSVVNESYDDMNDGSFWNDGDDVYDDTDNDDDNDDDFGDMDEFGAVEQQQEQEDEIPPVTAPDAFYNDGFFAYNDDYDHDNVDPVGQATVAEAVVLAASSPPKEILEVESIDQLPLPSPQEEEDTYVSIEDVHHRIVPTHDDYPPPPPRPNTYLTTTTTTTLPPTQHFENKYSDFLFFSDQKAVPSELKRLQETTRRRRRNLRNQHFHVELKIAKAASSFAEEKMDLGLAIQDTFERSCCKPLDEAMERIVMEKETVLDRRPAVLSLEQRLSTIEQQTTHHVHVEMSDAKKHELDTFNRDLQQEVIPSMRIEKNMADKIEGGVVRRYEHHAGLASKRFHSECARRKADLELYSRKMNKALQTQEQHSENILDTIRLLRRELKMEREERKAADQKLMMDVQKTSVAMRRAFLAAFDDEDGPPPGTTAGRKK
ncbi:MAG: hypothetical protein SGBAC_011184 [Bacillariaceae sp.]